MLAFYVFLALCSVAAVGVGAHSVIRFTGDRAEVIGGMSLAVMATAATIYFTLQALRLYHG